MAFWASNCEIAANAIDLCQALVDLDEESIASITSALTTSKLSAVGFLDGLSCQS